MFTNRVDESPLSSVSNSVSSEVSSKLTPINRPALTAAVAISLALQACGGGSGGSSEAPASTLPTYPAVTKAIDLTDPRSVRLIGAGVLQFLYFRDYLASPFPANIAHFLARPASSTLACSPGATYEQTYTLSAAALSVGDTARFKTNGCVSGTVGVNYFKSTGQTEYAVARRVGTVSLNAPEPWNVEIAANYQQAYEYDALVAGQREVSTATGSGRTTYTYVHDGKNTADAADDVQTITVSDQSSYTGKVNTADGSGQSTLSTNCVLQVAANRAICGAISGTSKGVRPGYGTYDVTFQNVGNLQIEPTGYPLGTIAVKLGSETVTVEFANMTATGPTISYKAPNGQITTSTFDEFLLLRTNF